MRGGAFATAAFTLIAVGVSCGGAGGTRSICNSVCDEISDCGDLAPLGLTDEQDCRHRCKQALADAEDRSVQCRASVADSLDCGTDYAGDDACDYLAPYFETLITGRCEDEAKVSMNACFGIGDLCDALCQQIDACDIANGLYSSCVGVCRFSPLGLYKSTACREEYVAWFECITGVSCDEMGTHMNMSQLGGTPSCSDELSALNAACGF